MGVWDASTPVGTESIAQGDNRIRELKEALVEIFRGGAADGTEALFPGSAPTTAPVFHYRGLKGTTAARPAAGQYGLYFNETLNTLQRDNSTAWVDVATLIPSGTKMLFYQASPPTGWTAVAVNDKFLRVVAAAGTGGTTGGTGLAPSSTVTLAHTHTVGSHTHSTPAHQHVIDYATNTTTESIVGAHSLLSGDTDGAGLSVADLGAPLIGSYTYRHSFKNQTRSGGSGTSGAATPATDSVLTNTAFQYADVCVGQKD